MDNDKNERILSMTISGTAAEEGRVSLNLLTQKLKALQKSLYNIAAAQEGRTIGQRGNWSKYTRLSCELIFKDIKKGSLMIELELPPSPPVQISLFPEEVNEDAGLNALNKFKSICTAVSNNKQKNIIDLFPDPIARYRFLKSLEPLLPREEDDINISFGNGKGNVYAMFTPETKKVIQDVISLTEDDEKVGVKVISGIIVELRAYAGTRHLIIKHRNREVTCYYPTDMEEEISQLIIGSVIEVTGMAQFNEDGHIRQIDDIIDIEMMDLSPFRIKRFICDNKKYILKEPVLCNIDYEGDLWIYEVPRYGLHAYSENRQEALSQIHDEFAFLYETFYNEKDENLTKKARQLRDNLREDLLKIEEIDING